MEHRLYLPTAASTGRLQQAKHWNDLMLKQLKSQILIGGMALAFLTVLLITPASAQKMYKWVDKQGKVTYQDQPPPQDAQKVDEYIAPGEESGTQTTAPVTLYSLPTCDACDLVRLLLQKNSVPFAEKNPSQDQAAAAELREKSGQLSVPSLTIGDKLLMGYNSLAIRDELKNAGYTLQDEPPATQDEATAAGAPLPPEGQPVSESSETGQEQEPEQPQQAEAEAQSPSSSDTGQELPVQQ